MIKLKELIKEGLWNTSAKYIAKSIFSKVKETVKLYSPDDFINDFREKFEDSTVTFTLEIRIIRNADYFHGDVYVDGFTGPTKAPNKMHIAVYINPAKEPGIYSKLYAQLYDVVRHELQHMTQAGPLVRPNRVRPSTYRERSKADKSGRYAYSVLPDEVDALVRGFFLRAKLEKLPITTVMKNELDYWLRMEEITKEEYSKIFDVWVTFTKKELPTARLS